MMNSASLARLHDRLSRETRAETRFDRGYRGLYSTDASLYQIEPLGVVLPRTLDDVPAILRIAAEEGAAVLPRGAATSLSGQTVGPAVIIDNSKYLNRIGVVDRDSLTVRVEPGVVLDRLNAHLAPLGLMFGPDVSTSDRASLGGMIGNNSAGARSLRFGKTVDHVERLDVVLDDGSVAEFGPLDESALREVCARKDRVGRLHESVRSVVETHRAAIEAHFPRILRRVSGYNLDEFVPGLPRRPEGWPDEPFRFNLSRLIVGSEGTLAVVRSAVLKVVPKPKAQGLVVLSFSTIPAALDRLLEIVETGPVAVEMLDRTILDLAAGNAEMARHLDFAEGRPEAVLAAQFYADTPEELAERADRLERLFAGQPGVLGIRKSLSEAAKDSFWKVRKAGLSLLMGMVGDAKPVAFVEDTAVAPQNLPAFYERFRQIIARQGAQAACYGHADVGCLHIRPILNVKTPEGVQQVRIIAREVADLVAEFGGAMSGEHGDGLARSRWNRRLFGEEVYGAFEAVKRAFDPENRLNPGKVVGDPDPADNLRLSPTYHAVEPESTALDFSNQGGFARAIEMCSGVGACRKNTGGTMCPSYMVTLEEEHTTRGRANALRLAISGQLPGGFADPALAEALDLCLQCKACKTECPSNVDLSKLKSEALYQKYKGRPVPLGSLLLGHVHQLSALGSRFAPLANATLHNRAFKFLLEKLAGIDRRRTLPTYARRDFRTWFRAHTPDPRAGRAGRVILLDDCFSTFHAPQVAESAVRVLEASGFSVDLAGLACCGRPAISKGLLDEARKLARENVEKLAEPARKGVPILGCEPSCLLTLVDEYRDFRLGGDAGLVAASAKLVEQFLADRDRVPHLPVRERAARVLLHGHCQQKALVGAACSAQALERVPGLEVQTLDSGCCGMAGSFGYEKGHYEVSEALAQRVLLPALAADRSALLAAPGFSCRSQVKDLAGISAQHPVEILAEALVEESAMP